jgi:hypothetical protein
MGCLPESGGCERQRTDPFVHHLNALEGTHFSHETCLDRVYRNSPQPEALYIDTDTGAQLVIERKTLVWPHDYPARHKNDHHVADLLLKGLQDLTSNAPYAIELEVGLEGRRDDLTAFARQITTVIRERFHDIEGGQIIGAAQVGRRWRFFREKPALREWDGEPETGLVVRWYPEETPDLASALPEELLEDISRLFTSCIQKFQTYLHARRILLIDPHGDLRYLGDFWWARVFKALPPPSGIPEIWMGTHDWITDREQDWIFEQLFPISTPHEENAV